MASFTYRGPNRTVNPQREAPFSCEKLQGWSSVSGEKEKLEIRGSSEEKRGAAHPLNTPRTRFKTKKEPKMTKLTKYTQGSSNPIASFI